MAEAGDFEKEAIVTLEENQLPAAVRVLYTARAAEGREDRSDAATQPLLRLQDRAAPDVADPKTSAPHELEPGGGDDGGCGGSVGSLCSGSSRQECHICREPLDSHTLLKCDHTLCHRCVAGIMRRARDQGRLRCPFCWQTSPFPQWEIRRLQEDFYSNCVHEAMQALSISPGPGPQAPPAANASPLCCYANTHTGGGCVCSPPSHCCSMTVAVLLVFLVLLGCTWFILS